MKQLITVTVAAALCAGLSLPVQAAERLNDKQVKAAVENLRRGFDTWKDALEKRNLDDAVIRNASGTIEVKKFLKDFQQEIDLVKDRLKPEYAANPEMTTVLRRASDVERRAQQPGQNPITEWKELSAQFAALAAAYGTTFPMPSADAVAMRWADKEVAERLADIERQCKVVAKEADNALKQAKAPAADRAKAKQALAALAASAKQTREMLNKGTATIAQAEATLKSIKTAGEIVGGLAMPGPGKTAWDTIGNQASVVAKSFGIAS
jgi:septal ring factor EnvC (AmiA/AmiB activator)